MVYWVRKVAKAISEKGGIFTFIRAQFSSQIASITDFLVTVLLGVLLNVYYVTATFIGSVCGGIVNCAINYKWTFKAQGVKKKYVVIKYILVWCGSIFLNTYGTFLLTEFLSKFTWLQELLGHFFDDIFIVSKAVVSLLVGWTWNYHMQRLFVYEDRKIKQFFFGWINHKNENSTNSEN